MSSGTAAPAVSMRAAVLALVAAASFGVLGPVTVLVTREGTPLLVAMCWRMLLGGALLLALAFAERHPAAVWPRGRTLWRLVSIGGIGQLLVTYLSLASLQYIPAPTQVFLFYSYPAWITLLQVARGAERLDGRRALALLLAFGGIALVLDPQQFARGLATAPEAATGVALVLGAAILYALYVPTLGWLQRETPPTVASAWIVLSGGGLFAVAALAVEGRLLPVPTAMSLGGIAVLAVICTGLAFWAFMRGLAGLGAVRMAILSTAEPFLAALYATVLLGQRPGPLVAVGGACIVAAVLLLVRAPRAAGEAVTEAPRVASLSDRP